MSIDTDFSGEVDRIVEEIAALKAELTRVRREWVDAETEKAGDLPRLVMAVHWRDGELEPAFLAGFCIRFNKIRPVLLQVKKDGTPSKRQAYGSDYRELEPPK